jgi:alpha-mannosidase
MRPTSKHLSLWILAILLLALGTQCQQVTAPGPDLTKQPTLYVVGYAHLDTQWRWDYVTTIRDYLPKTMRLNFDWFEKYPHYVFNFSGANRYRMMKEYYPEDYAKLKQYVADGRWFPAGSSMEENDVNSPSAESLIRQILYGKEFFRHEFGKTSEEFMLPDCFGFPASLPSVLAHCGIKGFSTQKLTWQSATEVGGPDSVEGTPEGIPFNVGVWEGLDGADVVAALNPGDYVGQVTYDLSKSPPPPPENGEGHRSRPATNWPARIQRDGQASGTFADYMYYGTGDTGGSANESSIKLMEAIVTKGNASPPPAGGRDGQAQSAAAPSPEVQVGDGPVKVISATSDQMFRDLTPEEIARLPKYKGDLELINHSAGSITSQAYMKRWNRKNEILADAAEKASIAAELLGGRPYPLDRLTKAWTLVMGAQFHDILPGTSIPKAYEYSWNDEVLAMNQFAEVLTGATDAVSSVMDTQTQGVPIVVFNPLSIPREDVVEASVAFPDGTPAAVRVVGPDGHEAPAQLEGGSDGKTKVVFVASVPSAGYAVYDVQPAELAATSETLRATLSSLENEYYLVTIDRNGDVTSIFDKALERELLSAPMRLAISTDNPSQWPAWNMDFEDEQRAPRTIVGGPAEIRVVEDGPARVAVQVERQAEGSRFVQTIRLAAGDAGKRVEFGHVMDWDTKEANLKAVFPLTASNLNATYNWDIGTIERPTAKERQFEVASHQWVDLTDQSGSFGVTILTDCKNASDKPDDHTLRLTLVRTPGTRGGYHDQGTQDIGHHEFVYGLAGHAGDFRQGQTDWQALRLNQPLIAFQSPSHPGSRGKSFSLMSVSDSRVRALALKKAEASDEYIVRLVEMDGKPASDVQVKLGTPVIAAREVNGAEEPVGPATVTDGVLKTSFSAFQPRTFAVKLGRPSETPPTIEALPVELPYDRCVATPDGRPGAGYFDSEGNALPAEMLPDQIVYQGIRFALAPYAYGKHDAVIALGQSIPLPPGSHTRLYLLAASARGDQKATFRIGDTPVDLTIQDWGGYVGQWDNRIWKAVEVPGRRGSDAPPRIDPYGEMVGLTPGFIKPAPVAWFASHRHAPDGTNEPYAYSYLFAYAIDVPAGAATLTLPNSDGIVILAATVTDEQWTVRPVQTLTDALAQ